MTDDELLALFESGSAYSRDALAKLADVYDMAGKTALAKQLNRLRQAGLIQKVPGSRDWQLAMATMTAANIPREAPKVSKPAPKVTKKKEVGKVTQPTNRQREAVNKLNDVAKPGINKEEVYTALLKVEHKLKEAKPVSDLEIKLYTLDFLGRLLDPTIAEVFESIAGDLKQLNS